MAVRKGKGSWERADLPAPKECEGTPCRRVLLPDRDDFGAGEETASAFPPLFSLPHSLPSLLSFPLISLLFRARLRSPQTTVLMGRMRLSSLSLHGIDGPWGEDGHPGEGGGWKGEV
jgi:hypothetical protein